ncbi:alpha/beta hydrolase [Candidatus Kaiserbacteria bacterium]|nr:alpha/beta hydrolase [Candidatus Kaiserbacteria bacterium]
MKNALILHGLENSSKGNWFSWLKVELEKNGWKVWVPDLPGSEKPNIERHNDFIFSSGWKLDQDSVIVGHSAGAIEILGLLGALPEGTLIKAGVLVGAFKDDLGWESLKELFEKPFDFETIKTRAKKFIILHSDDDPICPVSGAEEVALKLGGEFIVQHGQKHFNLGTMGEKYKEFPFLLDLMLKL